MSNVKWFQSLVLKSYEPQFNLNQSADRNWFNQSAVQQWNQEELIVVEWRISWSPSGPLASRQEQVLHVHRGRSPGAQAGRRRVARQIDRQTYYCNLQRTKDTSSAPPPTPSPADRISKNAENEEYSDSTPQLVLLLDLFCVVLVGDVCYCRVFWFRTEFALSRFYSVSFVNRRRR